jgi:L-lactate dehydrogenase complex protein LldG
MIAAIRRGLRRGPLRADQVAMLRARLAEHPRGIVPARSRLPRPAQIDLFVANAEREFATVTRVASPGGIPAAVADYLARQNLPSAVRLAPEPALRVLPWADRPTLTVREGRAQADDLVAVQAAWAGVAETGTLVIPSGHDRPNTLNLLPDTEIAVLRASRVVGAYEEAWDLLRAEYGSGGGGQLPRTVLLVTGPSRSADIEQTLELGAHGPRRLHIVLVEDDPAGLAQPEM